MEKTRVPYIVERRQVKLDNFKKYIKDHEILEL
jgi:hypothetical protein